MKKKNDTIPTEMNGETQDCDKNSNEDGEQNTELRNDKEEEEKEDRQILESDQQESERMAKLTMEPMSTCLQLDEVQKNTFCIAPRERQKPIYILNDDNYEVMSFPDLFPFGRGGFVSEEKRHKKTATEGILQPATFAF